MLAKFKVKKKKSMEKNIKNIYHPHGFNYFSKYIPSNVERSNQNSTCFLIFRPFQQILLYFILFGIALSFFFYFYQEYGEMIWFDNIPTPKIKEIISETTNYQPSYKPFFYTNKTLKQINYEKECMQFVNGEEETDIDKKCFTNSQNMDLLCCHLNVLPSERNKEHILVLGSSGVVGRELVKMLDANNELFIEVKGTLHFDIGNDVLYTILDTINIKIVFDLTRTSSKNHKKVSNYFKKRNVNVIRLVNHLSNLGDNVIQIQLDKKPLGNQYLGYHNYKFFKSIFDCINFDKCQKLLSLSFEKYYLAYDIAYVLYKNFMISSPGKFEISLKEYTRDDIFNNLTLFKQNKLEENSGLYYIFKSIELEHKERMKKPYLTMAFLVTNGERYIKFAQRTMDFYGELLENFPDISIEFIQFFYEQNISTFLENVRVPKNVAERLHIIEISGSESYFLNTVFKIRERQVPEYYFRNIAMRLGQGELLFTNSEDVLPSPCLFRIAQRKQVSPLAILRSMRWDVNIYKKDLFYNYKMKNIPKHKSFLKNISKIQGWQSYLNSNWGCSGDLQGATREAIFKINGWPWGYNLYYTDTAFEIDMKSFKVPFYEIAMYKTFHAQHPTGGSYGIYDYLLESNLAPKERIVNLCAGFPTSDKNISYRPNWGVSYDFMNENGKYSHLLYTIKPIENQEKPWVSNFSLRLIENDKPYEY